jgi:ribosomal protein L18
MDKNQLKIRRASLRKNKIVKVNIKRAIMQNVTKYVIKIRNTNNHIYCSVFHAANNKYIISSNTIKYRKLDQYKTKYTMTLIELMLNDIMSYLFDVKLKECQIIWDLGHRKYQGRIKQLITILLHNLNKHNEKTSSTNAE